MLRLILGISGVGLILLGMFGKGPLENIHNRFASQTDNAVAVELPAVANPVVLRSRLPLLKQMLRASLLLLKQMTTQHLLLLYQPMPLSRWKR